MACELVGRKITTSWQTQQQCQRRHAVCGKSAPDSASSAVDATGVVTLSCTLASTFDPQHNTARSLRCHAEMPQKTAATAIVAVVVLIGACFATAHLHASAIPQRDTFSGADGEHVPFRQKDSKTQAAKDSASTSESAGFMHNFRSETRNLGKHKTNQGFASRRAVEKIPNRVWPESDVGQRDRRCSGAQNANECRCRDDPSFEAQAQAGIASVRVRRQTAISLSAFTCFAGARADTCRIAPTHRPVIHLLACRISFVTRVPVKATVLGSSLCAPHVFTVVATAPAPTTVISNVPNPASAFRVSAHGVSWVPWRPQ